jgi:preprotein translocase subunit SecA
MDNLKEGIGLRAYGQVNPIVAYTKEAFEMFTQMKDEIRQTAIRLTLLLEFVQQRKSVVKSAQENISEGGEDAAARRASSGAGRHKDKGKVGRNDPCPCGSGKKHKHCCLNKP